MLDSFIEAKRSSVVKDECFFMLWIFKVHLRFTGYPLGECFWFQINLLQRRRLIYGEEALKALRGLNGVKQNNIKIAGCSFTETRSVWLHAKAGCKGRDKFCEEQKQEPLDEQNWDFERIFFFTCASRKLELLLCTCGDEEIFLSF